MAIETKSEKRMKKIEKVDNNTGEITEDFLDEKQPVTSNAEERQDKIGEGIHFNVEFDVYGFNFKKMAVTEKKDATERTLDVNIISRLSEFKTGYWFIMVFDEQPYEQRISSEHKKKAEYEADNQMQLFNTTKAKELQKFDERIHQIKVDREKMRAQCPEIRFYGSVQNIDTSSTFPVLTVIIMPKTVNLLNSAWNLIKNYKVQLQ